MWDDFAIGKGAKVYQSGARVVYCDAYKMRYPFSQNEHSY